MKKWPIHVMLFCIAGALSAFAEGAAMAPADSELVTFAQQRTNAVRVTVKPVRMLDRVATLCNANLPQQKIGADPHSTKYADVFVSQWGASAMKTDAAVFPVGAIILKEKFSDAEGKKTELFTGMLKRERGYNPICGDWEFFTLSADAKQVTARGKLQNCMDCHADYKSSDFVTKSYYHFSY